MGKVRFEREDEVTDGLVDFIQEILEEASPFLPKETLKKLAKERGGRAYDFIRDQLEAVQEEKEEIDKYAKIGRDELENLKNEVKDLYDIREKLEEKLKETEELFERAAPGAYHARRYGV